VVCEGDTTVAVNLYALGVFSAFTLSQAGMVVRWWRLRGPGWLGRLLMNALGSLTTFVVLIVIVVSKFDEGAWTVVIAIPLLVWMLARVRYRYDTVYRAIGLGPNEDRSLRLPQRRDPLGNISLVWVPSLSRPSLAALRYAATVSDRVVAVWVLADDDDPAMIRRNWQQCVGDTAPAGLELVLLDSPFASLVDPFAEFVADEEQRHPESTFTIVMPMAIPRYRFDGLLLNQRGLNMRRALDARRSRVFTLVRYYLPA
jgi:hypothetical protein